MGHKVHPHAMRVGHIRQWESRWQTHPRQIGHWLLEDVKIREHVKKLYSSAAVARVEIERTENKVRIFIHTARPGVLIGRRGAEIDKLREELAKITPKQISVEIQEIKQPAADPQLIAESIAMQLIRRIAHRRAMKKALTAAELAGVQGIKIMCKGRLGGAEMSRVEWYRRGRVPLHTIRANIEYGFFPARTTYGVIGVKVWVYRGDVLQSRRGTEKTASDVSTAEPTTVATEPAAVAA